MKIFISLIILTLLNGCYCMTDTENTSNVVDYFKGCWNIVDGTTRKQKASAKTTPVPLTNAGDKIEGIGKEEYWENMGYEEDNESNNKNGDFKPNDKVIKR